MKEMEGTSRDILKDNIEALGKIFPEAMEEGKVDFDKLKQLLGEYVDDDEERYSFKWNGKGRALRLSQTPSTGTLRPCKEESKDWDTTQNLYIEGDNLEVLKLLQKSYYGKVKMIYIDPPYNTGNDFVYKDDFKDNIENYKKITGQVDEEGNRVATNTESDGRFHTNWLNMMYPRLRLARNLLTDDGVIFISIDDNEQENLKRICNEVFGEQNFFACVHWHRNYASANDSKTFANVIDYVLVYRKSSVFRRNLLPRTEKQNVLYKYDSNDGKGRWRSDNLSVRTYSQSYDYPIKNPNTGTVYNPPKGRCWITNKETMAKWIEEGRVYFGVKGDGAPQLKRYLSEVQDGVVPTSYWSYDDCGHNDEARKEIKLLFGNPPFDSPKPTKLLKQILHIATNGNDFILDFFSGSATTAHAVMQLNAEDGGHRKFIMVQLPEPTDENSEANKAGYKNICEIGKERIRRAGEKIKAEAGDKAADLDIGFKVFKLDTSNIKKWQPEEELILSLENSLTNFVDGRTEMDVVYEIMLKMGLDLTYPVEERKVGEQNVYVIGSGALMICLADGITQKTAAGIVKLKEEYEPETWQVVVRDNGFASDEDKTNAQETLKAAGLDEGSFVSI